MPKKLQDYLFKIKKPTPKLNFPSNSFTSSKNWILSGCKNPKTLSFAVGRNEQNDTARDENDDISAKLSDIDRFLFENFKSLYIKDDVVQSTDQENSGALHLLESPRFGDRPVPKLSGSNRFFVSPGVSGSLVEESRTGMATTTTTNSDDVLSSTSTSDEHRNVNGADVSLPDECVAVLAYSSNPCEEFRRSMEEMVEARLGRGEDVDWGFVEELLLCYLNLNDKKSHKHILCAFVNLVVDLRHQDSGDHQHGSSARNHRMRRKLKERERGREREEIDCNVSNW